MSAVKPTATGTFGGTPLLNLLVYALDHRLTGSFVFEAAIGRSALGFVSGKPVKVRTAAPVALLGDVLIELGAIGESERDAALVAAREAAIPIGAALVERQAIDLETLEEALAEQLCRKVEWLNMLGPDVVYGFYADQDFLAGFGGKEAPALDPLALVRRVARGVAPAQVNAVVSRLGDRPLRMHRFGRASRFAFNDREKSVVDVLRVKSYSLAELIKTGLLPEGQLRNVVYTLVITRHLDVGSEASPPVGVDVTSTPQPITSSMPPAVRRSGAPRNSTPSAKPSTPVVTDVVETADMRAFKKEIVDLAQRIGSLNYYEILGVDPKTPQSAISAAFFNLAKRWHPDRLSAAFADVKEEAGRVFSRMTEAHQVLSNDEQRREYERLMKEGGATDEEQEKVQTVLRAATAFQKAEVLVRRGTYAEAEKEAKLAYELDPEQAEYIALYADILSMKPNRKSFDDVVRMVNEAKEMQEDNIKVHLYRARVLKRAGDIIHALREFQWVAERDAGNVEAAREVRLYRMRKGDVPKSSKPPAKGGLLNQDIGDLFGKIFKR